MNRKVSIQWLEPGKAKLRWREGGKHRSKTVNGSERDAERMRIRIEDRLAGRVADPEHTTLAEVADAYFATMPHLRDWAHRTLYGSRVEYDTNIAPYLSDCTMHDLRHVTVEDWLVELRRRGVGAESRRKALKRLRAILKFGVGRDYVSKNVAASVDLPKPPPKRTIVPLTPLQIEIARAERIRLGNPRDALLFSLIGYQGLRPGEAFGLRVGSINLKRQRLLIDARVTLGLNSSDGTVSENGVLAAGTKTNTTREVTLHGPVTAELSVYLLSLGRPSDVTLLFPNRHGEPFAKNQYDAWRRKRFKPAFGSAGRSDATPYMLRHSAASLLLWSGRTINYVAREFGHSPAMSMRTYQHVIEDLEFDERVPVDEAIRRARAEVAGRREVGMIPPPPENEQ